MPDRPRIAIVATGGTIASISSTDQAAVPSLSAQDLVAAVPELADVADLQPLAFRQVPSPELTIPDLLALAEQLRNSVAHHAQGVVITQGTDTLEETSFVLDLLWDRDEPVVVTGAMRNPGIPGADGPANLLAAVQVASSPAARGLGCLVVFNDEIHLPLFVRKSHTSNPATFRSPLTGPIGWIAEGRVRIALRPVLRHHIGFHEQPGAVPEVALVKVTLGDRGRLLEAVEGAHPAGLVVEATGGGHVPAALVEPLARLASLMPVVLCSRTGAGEVLQTTYGFPGSERDLLSRGLIPAFMLDGPKARLLLTLLLMAQVPRSLHAECFEAVGAPGSRAALSLPATD